jgi:hypothetical protein
MTEDKKGEGGAAEVDNLRLGDTWGVVDWCAGACVFRFLHLTRELHHLVGK